MADLDVIVVSFNSASYLAPCLRSIYAHAGDVELDVVVVDNDSTDGSPELVEAQFPQARVLRNENLGFAHGNNRGFEVTGSPYVLFVNPDVEIRAGTFADLLVEVAARPRLGLMGCRQLTEDGDVYPTIRRFPTPSRSLFEALGSGRFPIRASWMGERELDLAVYERESPCDWVSGSFMLARRQAVEDAGLMDERFFLFSEETDLCMAMKEAGWEVRYLPEMTIFHDFGKNGLSPRLSAQEAYARRQYLFKRSGTISRGLSTAGLALFHARRAVGSIGPGDRRTARRAAAQAALAVLLGRSGPPFGDRSGPLRGLRPSDGAPGSLVEALDQRGRPSPSGS
jgi:N-acetylglucosaminyl-diphospho-decaprenol L-rhamnosyltransferase